MSWWNFSSLDVQEEVYNLRKTMSDHVKNYEHKIFKLRSKTYISLREVSTYEIQT